MANRERRRSGASRRRGQARAVELARRLGVGLRDGRLTRGLRQLDVATCAGVSQTWISKMERGHGQSASLETWASVAAALGRQLAAFMEAAPGADRPRDYEHLKRQQLVIEIAARGGWRALPELAIDPGPGPSRSVDVLLERLAPGEALVGEALVVEVWDFFDDVGAALRGLDRKVAFLAERNASGGGGRPDRGPPAAEVRGALVVRGTRRNRALANEFRHVFAARFPGSGADLLAALTDPSHPLPTHDTFLWTDVAATRLMPSRLGR